jgi:hypothetical protein
MMQATTDNMTHHALTTAGMDSLCAYEGVCERGAGGRNRRVDWLAAARAGRSAADAPIETGYTPDPAISQAMKAEFLRRAGQRDPAAAETLRAEMARRDFIQEYARAVREYGFNTHDLADALTAYWVMGWMLANQIGPDDPAGPRRASVLAVRDQVRAALSLNAGVRRMGHADLQRMTESLILSFVVNAVIFNTVSRPESRGRFDEVSAATRRGLYDFFGVDPAQLELTESGFARRR